jgi:uncharacterized SAM-binding protein YcdF (DUF218 family)
VLLVAVAGFAAATVFLFVVPDSDPVPARADAIVVLAGGRVERLEKGLQLWHAGVAPTLVISDGRAVGWTEANRLCREAHVLCFRPDPYSTRGEAEWTGRAAARRGWRSVAVVTSTYHVRRSREVFERCFKGSLAVIAARPRPENFAVGVAWEWPKSAYYLIFRRGC